MFELLIGFLLEVVLFLLLVLFAIVYMESIWGEWIEDHKENEISYSTIEDRNTTSVDNFPLETEIPDFQDTSSDEEQFQLNETLSEHIDLGDYPSDKKSSTEYLVCDETSEEGSDINETLNIHFNPKSNIFIHTIESTKLKLNILDKQKFCKEPDHKYIVNIPKYINILSDTCRAVKILDSVKMDWYFDVNGASFAESEGTKYDGDAVAECELYKVDTEEDDDWTPLELRVQPLSQGVLLNSNVVLQPVHWHCMAPVDDHLVHCALCQMYCDKAASEHHMQSASHLRNLRGRTPLRKYDLAIVRKIDSNLHCGVCNEIVDVIDFKAHENKKSHEENLLRAINKVSDLADDAHLSNRQTHAHIDSVDGTPRPHSASNPSQRTTHINAPGNYRNVSETKNTPETTRNTGEYHFNAKALNNMCSDNISVYEHSESEEEYTSEEEEEERVRVGIQEGIDRGFYPALAEDEEIEEYQPPVPGFSYASMAKKPVIELPKFLKIDLGSKMFRVRHDSWHMVTALSSNQYYCMACRARGHVARRAAHCTHAEHASALAACAVLPHYQDHLVRQVDDKLAHCAHCNTLQVQDEMEQHLLARHPPAHRNYVEKAGALIQPQKTESDKSGVVDKRLEYSRPNYNVFGDITLNPFGIQLKIPILNFNLIQKRGEEHYCLLCDAACPDVQVHVEEQKHVELMTMAPYIKPFNNNLIRAVRGVLHCSLCNSAVRVAEARDHNLAPAHTSALAAALGMQRGRLPHHISSKVYKPTFLPSEPLLLPLPTPPVASDQGLAPHGPSANNQSVPGPLSVKTTSSQFSIPFDSTKKTKTEQDVPVSPKDAGRNSFFLREAQDYQNNLRAGNTKPAEAVGQSVLTVRPAPPPVQNIPVIKPNMLHNAGQAPHVNTQAIKSIPPMFNPLLSGVAPPPFGPYISPSLSPSTLSPSQSMRNIHYDPSLERKTLIITDKNDKDGKDGGTSPISGTDVTNTEVVKSGTPSRCDSEGSKTNSISETNSESEDEDTRFDEEEMVFVKFKNNYFKITNSSYHSLMYLDKGLRYCFVCSTRVLSRAARAHVTSKKHAAAMKHNQFLDKYGLQLYRQMYLVYHCAVCNVMVPGSELRRHAAWAPHAEAYAQQHVDSKSARKELKAGIREHAVSAQREAVYRAACAPHEPRVLAAYRIVRDTAAHARTDAEMVTRNEESHVKKNKMVIHGDVVMVLSFEQWHSISGAGGGAGGARCALCQRDLAHGQVWEHISSAEHVAALGAPVESAHLPALIRRIDAHTVQCMTCNVSLVGSREHVSEHAAGRRHALAVDAARRARAYTGCYEDCLVL